ncbi:Uma2 family endonuclease [Thermoanaerobacterium thermosaccharolyticum]|jgi:Uma2 family endonuclease|uniref:Uma2 family endonuclease n=1 Tax=Thermoanaerobacterium thermosaccharolyticum TaxID=1517 RepID=UPI00123AFE98|nr:Uma2 family endonuclease [Thermoanaerobacterium thermosaccharolyticum]KAA5807898.1 Uma2 family endonuclease [Thermoanaerobacterium thermosaccharolyticum]
MSKIIKNNYTEVDYENWPEDERIELIDGQIYVMAPPSRVHQEVSMQLSVLIYNYIASKGGRCKVYSAPFDVRLKDKNDKISRVQPDISIVCDEKKLNDKGCDGAPDMIIEIASPSSLSRDYVVKVNLYQNSGVKEYWIVNPHKKSIIVFRMNQNDEYNEVDQYSFDDTIKVGIFEDLKIDFKNISM